jgi:hypothetical protein
MRRRGVERSAGSCMGEVMINMIYEVLEIL